MAPETYLLFLRREDAVCEASPAVDIYAFGVILWELCIDWTGAGIVDVADLMSALAQYAPGVERIVRSRSELASLWEWPDLTAIPASCSPMLRALIERCWTFDDHSRLSFDDMVTGTWFAGVEDGRMLQRETKVQMKSSVVASTEGCVLELTRVDGIDDPGVGDGHNNVATGSVDRRNQPPPLPSGVSAPNSISSGDIGIAALSSVIPADMLRRTAEHKSINCVNKLWHRCGLHFQSAAEEEGFGVYKRNTGVFTSLRWAYFSFAVISIIVLVADMAATGWSTSIAVRACPGAFRVVLFASMWLLSFPSCTNITRRADTIVASLTLLYLLTLCACNVYVTQYAPEYQPQFFNFTLLDSDMEFGLGNVVFHDWQTQIDYGDHTEGLCLAKWAVTNASGVCAGNVTSSFQNGDDQHLCYMHNQTVIVDSAYLSFQFNMGRIQYAMSYGLFFLESLTIPVVLMTVGLPLRLYGPLLSLPFATVLGLLAVAFTGAVDNGYSVKGVFRLCCVLMAAVVLYTSCIVGSFRQERSRRSLFVLHVALQTELDTLSQDVEFRKYREVMRKNREEYEARLGSG